MVDIIKEKSNQTEPAGLTSQVVAGSQCFSLTSFSFGTSLADAWPLILQSAHPLPCVPPLASSTQCTEFCFEIPWNKWACSQDQVLPTMVSRLTWLQQKTWGSWFHLTSSQCGGVGFLCVGSYGCLALPCSLFFRVPSPFLLPYTY